MTETSRFASVCVAAFLLAAPARATTPEGTSISEYLSEGRRLLSERRIEAAIDILQGGLREHPGVPDLATLLGRVYETRGRERISRGEMDAAEADLAQALAAAPDRRAQIQPLLDRITTARVEADLARGDPDRARARLADLRRGRRLSSGLLPLSARVHLVLAETQSATGRTHEAIGSARRALGDDSSLVAADLLLARLYYERQEMALAREHLRDAERKARGRIRGIEEAIARVESEGEATRNFSAMEAGHLRVLFDGAARPELFQIALPALDEAVERAARILEGRSDRPITVILYTSEGWVRSTSAPDWANGLYDGKIRIRAGEVLHAAALRRVARHEAAHAVLETLYPGRIPAWVHEGVAQIAEVDDWDAPPGARDLVAIVRAGPPGGPGRWIPLSELEEPFASNPTLRDDTARVAQAYAQSAAAIACLRRLYGPGKMVAFLQALGAGSVPAAAIREATFLSPEGFEARVRDFVTWEYGR